MARVHQIVSTRFPRIPISINIAGKFRAQEYALVDTGFDGGVIVPEIAREHNIGKPEGQVFVAIGDGSIISAPLYVGKLELTADSWNPAFILPIAILGDDYILGREILDKFEITLDHGKRVIVKP